MNLDDLKKPFDPALISWRVGATTKDKDKGIALAYIDARDVMERLDEVCGIDMWQCRYPFKGCCEIGIYSEDEWVWKSNGAGETQVEADKGQYSDAFKRAAVMWGVGRYLYDVQNTWVKLKPQGRSYAIADPNATELKRSLDNAAKGIRVASNNTPPPPYKPEKKEATKEEKRDWFSKKVSEMVTGLNTIESIDDLNKFTTKMSKIIDGLSDYPDLNGSWGDAYAKRLGELK